MDNREKKNRDRRFRFGLVGVLGFTCNSFQMGRADACYTSAGSTVSRDL